MMTALTLKRTLLISEPFQIILASLLLALSSQISLPLSFTPVPLTLQTLTVMLLGVTLGPQKATLSVLLYLFEGSLGLPVFSGGGSGVFHLFGPKCGYLFGFLIQAFTVGTLFERVKPKHFNQAIPLLFFSSALQLGFGVLGLSLFIPLKTAFTLGFTPFILGEALKAILLLGCLERQPPQSF
jgi:biotin transport system substrate-specific component